MSARKWFVFVAFIAGFTPAVVSARGSEGAELMLSQPARQAQFILDGAVWTCDGTVCRSNRVEDMPALRSCKRVVAETGAVTAFTWRGKTLSAAEIAACNEKAR